MNQQVGEITQGIQQALAAIPVDLTLVPQGSLILDRESQKGTVQSTATAQATAIGIPQAQPTQLDDEQRLEALGLIMIRGILYLADSSGNIDDYRRLFFAVGSDITTFLSIVEGAAPYAVTQTRLEVQQLPRTTAWTLELARTALANPAIEALYVAGDGDTYVIVPTFLGLNVSAAQMATQFQIPATEIVTQVFWLTQVTQTPQVLSQLAALGISGDQLSASLFGQRLLDFNPNAADSSKQAAVGYTGTALAQLGMLNARFTLLDPTSLASLQQESLLSIGNAQIQWELNQQQVRFWSTVLTRPADITDFLVKNTQDDLVYLFTRRQTVSGINFQATSTQIMQAVTQALSIPAGGTTISSLVINANHPQLDPAIDQSNQSLVKNTCAHLQMIQPPPLNVISVQTAIGCLNQALQTNTPLTPQATPIVGYASFDSPSSLLLRQMDVSATFNTDGILNELSALAAPLNSGLTFVILAIVALLKTIQTAIDSVFATIQATIAPLIAQIEGFLSRFMAYHGTLSLDSSILKCALGLNLGVALPEITELSGFVDLLRRKLRNILASFSQVISTLLNKLLCLPLNMINSYITAAESSLPSFCKLNRVQMPANVEAALLQLRSISQLQSDNVQAFSMSALKLSATTQALPLKLAQFQQSALCESQTNSSFFKATQQVSILTAGPNPLALAAGALP
jgi:hypothetical protein